MNVIVTNKQKQVIDNANIDAIKDLNGLFYVDDLISKFKNYFFSKMILDATSVVDFTKDEVLEKLANEIGAEKLFILLPATPEPPEQFVNKLIDYGIYNFSNKIEDIIKYIDNPNTYDKMIHNEAVDVDNSYQENPVNENYQSDYQSNDYSSYNTTSSFSDAINNIDIDDSVEKSMSTSSYDDNTDITNDNAGNVINEQNEEVNNYNSLEEDNNIDRSNYEFYINKEENSDDNNDESVQNYERRQRYVLGIKNVTLHAGSTTFVYLLLKKLSNYNVCAIEINRDDFKFFQDNRMISVNEREIEQFLNNNTSDIILVDLNNCQNTSFCNDTLYLVEPSVIKLNRLMMENRLTFRELQFKKIVLNKSLLSSTDVDALSKEAGVKMFFNMPPVNERVDNKVINELIKKLGI